MKLTLVRHCWGVDHTRGLDPHLPRWRDAGYEAVESSLEFSPNRPALEKFLKISDWRFIAQIFSNTHEAWWDIIWNSQNQRRLPESTLAPEFGPPPYLPVLPYSQAPVADLADICDWMARRQAARFASMSF